MTHPPSRQKLAILYGPLLHYRIALFNALCDRYEVTVYTTSFDGSQKGLRFNVEIVIPYRIGVFMFQPGLCREIRKQRFDACIVFFDVTYISLLRALFFPVAPRMFVWGIWLTTMESANRLRLAAIDRSEAAIFYCHSHLEEAVKHGANRDKLYVAPNTVAVPKIKLPSVVAGRNSILFVGSFTKRKGLDRLLRIFASLLNELDQDIRLVLLGDGPERMNIKKLTSDLGLDARVEMPGRVNDSRALAPYYAHALFTVSLSQAGLSVLQSMGFGVPFLTIQDSISGGETQNIVNGVNGYIVEDNDDVIAEAILNSTRDRQKAVAMGRAARDHYIKYATIENYAQGFFDALEGTDKASIWGCKRSPQISTESFCQGVIQ